MAEPVAATPRAILGVFLKVGLSSFGGGSTTLMLMQRELVQRRGWLTAEQFAFVFGLSTLVPGINILAQTILIGRLLAGAGGALCALLGMVVPAAALTVIISAAFVAVQHTALVIAALHGVLPATVGMTIATAWTMWPRAPRLRLSAPRPAEPQYSARPLWRERLLDGAIAIVAFLLLFGWHWQVPIVLAAGGVAGLVLWGRASATADGHSQ